MAKLIVYGCSFSCAFQDLQHLPPIEESQGWPKMVADSMGYEYVDRSEPGYGWNHIVNNIDEDQAFKKFTKEDILIISPSYFQRLTFPEIDDDLVKFKNTEGGAWTEFAARYGKSQEDIVKSNVIRFYLKIKTLRELGYNVYGWCWSMGISTYEPWVLEFLKEIEDYIVPAPDSTLLWEDWILNNPNCMLIPGKRLPNGDWSGDTHFSIEGHRVAAEQFIKVLSIKKKAI